LQGPPRRDPRSVRGCRIDGYLTSLHHRSSGAAKGRRPGRGVIQAVSRIGENPYDLKLMAIERVEIPALWLSLTCHTLPGGFQGRLWTGSTARGPFQRGPHPNHKFTHIWRVR